MDDYVLIHVSKDYLKKSLDTIKEKLENEYKIKLNEKRTYIFNCKQECEFLGYTFKVVDKKTIIKINGKKRQAIRKGIKRTNYLYKNNYIKFNQYFSSIETFKNGYIFVSKKRMKDFVNKYNG